MNPVKTVLNSDEQSIAELALQGVPDNPLPIMLYQHFRSTAPSYQHHTAEQRRTYNRLAAAAKRAAADLTPEDRHYWAQRQIVRSMGGDVFSVARPAPLGTERETPEQRRQRLLTMDLRPSASPSWHRRGDRSPEAQQQRAALWADWNEAKVLQKEAAKRTRAAEAEQQRVLRQMEKDLHKQERTAPDNPTTGELRLEVRRAQAHARYLKSWPERVVEDELAIIRLGRTIPRAARHPLAGTPMLHRPHHPSGD